MSETEAKAESVIPDPIAESAVTADDILNSADHVFAKEPAPEIGKGKFIYVKMPSAIQLEALNAEDYKDGAMRRRAGYLARWFVACAVDRDGKFLFNEKQAKALEKKAGSLLTRVFSRAIAGQIAEHEIVEEAKNS